MGVCFSREEGVCKGSVAGLHTEELSEGWVDLEGFGAAQTIPIWVEDIVKVDISGFVLAPTRGCSRDEYIYTLA